MGTSSTEQYCLRWNDFHANVANAFSDIRDEEDFLDVTLVNLKTESHIFSYLAKKKQFKSCTTNMATFVIIRHPVTILVTYFTKPDNLTDDLLILNF